MSIRVNYPELSPDAYRQLLGFEKLWANSAIDKTTKDLVKIRASQMNGCLFCTDMHSKEARIHQERELRLHHLAFWRESELFTAKEKAALEWTELLTRIGTHGIEDSDFEKVKAHYSDKEIADLTMIIGNINFWNRLGVAFRPTAGGLDKMMGLDKAGLT